MRAHGILPGTVAALSLVAGATATRCHPKPSTSSCFNIIAHGEGSAVDGQPLVAQTGYSFPFFGPPGGVWETAVLKLTPEGYIEQVGAANQGGVFGYNTSPYFVFAPLSYYQGASANGYTAAVCTLDPTALTVTCSASGYGSQIYAAKPTDNAVDYDLYWYASTSGTDNTPTSEDDYTVATMSYVEVNCPVEVVVHD
ncbi:hypothetical protein SBRCBS47491_004811 [Sporothrix bragantina]|uniref:IgE-binding protein n=1 Tax=Sporothrix bragantina TaxID=671064 RepID=A0ABP0BRR2_9PEZI